LKRKIGERKVGAKKKRVRRAPANVLQAARLQNEKKAYRRKFVRFFVLLLSCVRFFSRRSAVPFLSEEIARQQFGFYEKKFYICSLL
jgi:hypothetical protein